MKQKISCIVCNKDSEIESGIHLPAHGEVKQLDFCSSNCAFTYIQIYQSKVDKTVISALAKFKVNCCGSCGKPIEEKITRIEGRPKHVIVHVDRTECDFPTGTSNDLFLDYSAVEKNLYSVSKETNKRIDVLEEKLSKLSDWEALITKDVIMDAFVKKKRFGLTDEKLLEIVKLFCTWNSTDGSDVCGMDMHLFDSLEDAKKAIENILIPSKEEKR